MSATRRGNNRRELDGYFTDPELAAVLVERLVVDGFVEREGSRVLEPHCGMGAFAAAAARLTSPIELVVNDLDREATRCTMAACEVAMPGRAECSNVDFLEFDKQFGGVPLGRFDFIPGNPPFGRETGRVSEHTGKPIVEPVAHLHVVQALRLLARGGCLAFLMRLAMVEAFERYEFWRANRPARIYSLTPRPSFTGGQTDNCAYGLFVWQRGVPVRATEFDILKWRDKRRGKADG